jgi:hypothetical protein
MVGWLSLFAVSMGFLEAVVVVYLRRIHYPDNPLTLFPMRIWSPEDLLVEMARELATVLMILAAAALAVTGKHRIFAAFSFIFGVWDIAYYLWLKLLLGWPADWLEWDILFLIPWAWLGPWIAPAAVAVILALWGGWVLWSGREYRFGRAAVLLFGSGGSLVLLSFLRPAWPLLSQGPEGLPGFRPGGFLWQVYLPGLASLAAGLLFSCRVDVRKT